MLCPLVFIVTVFVLDVSLLDAWRWCLDGLLVTNHGYIGVNPIVTNIRISVE